MYISNITGRFGSSLVPPCLNLSETLRCHSVSRAFVGGLCTCSDSPDPAVITSQA